MKPSLTLLTGASRGMGLAMARQLLAAGRTVVGLSRQVNHALADEAAARGATLLQWPTDLADAPAAAAQLGRWLGGQTPRELDGADLDLAVARGAACYARNALSGKGIRIRAGTARSYYLGLESTGPAVPGIRRPVRGLCVVPQGLEEGSAVELPDREFGLVTGQRAEFRFFGSTVRAGDKPGVIIPDAEATLEETSRLEVELPAPKGETPGSVVPVKLQARVTELGTLELWMQHTASDHRWKLEFGVRTQ